LDHFLETPNGVHGIWVKDYFQPWELVRSWPRFYSFI
jgi:hypothetical protein